MKIKKFLLFVVTICLVFSINIVNAKEQKETKDIKQLINTKIKKYFEKKDNILNSNNPLKSKKYMEILDIKDKQLSKNMDIYDEIRINNYNKNNLKFEISKINFKEKSSKNENGNYVIKIERFIEKYYYFNGVKDSIPGGEQIFYKFTFNKNGELIKYWSSDSEEMNILNSSDIEFILHSVKKSDTDISAENLNNDIDFNTLKSNSFNPFNNILNIRTARRYNFNRTAMYNYARTHAYDYNENYGDFTYYGGDCTNFVSQIIKAGGAPYDTTGNYVWYYYDIYTNNYSYSWSSVNSLYYYLTGNDYIGPQGTLANTTDIQYGMMRGDVVQINTNYSSDNIYEHAVAIVFYQPGSTTSTKVAAHTANAFNKPLSEYVGIKRYIKLTGYYEE